MKPSSIDTIARAAARKITPVPVTLAAGAIRVHRRPTPRWIMAIIQTWQKPQLLEVDGRFFVGVVDMRFAILFVAIVLGMIGAVSWCAIANDRAINDLRESSPSFAREYNESQEGR